ncbi:MAG: GerAB/ArcD/ProY family transporter, partial [Clostridiales bacterium]|nr:GerAB/ArcD/ProY family transporter [Clostridiales bacterium]
EIRIDYWTPIFTEQVSNVLLGGYEVFLPLSLIFLVLFLGDYVEKREGLFLAGKRALLFSGGVYAVLYLILLGIFGAQALSSMKFPAVTLMSTVKISGGFLKRTDAFMFGIWFFTLYALLSSTVFYGAAVLRALVGADGHNLSVRSRQKRERISAFAVILAVFGVACTLYRSKEMLAAYERFLWYIATPFVVLVPLLLWAAHFLGKKQLSVLALFLLSSTLLCGCNTAELEERSFPIELGIADTDSFAKEWLNVNQAGNRVVDYSHLKVMLLEKELLENEESMEELLELLEEKADMPRNTYIVATENLKAMMEQTGEDGESVGNYLEQFFENVSEVKKRMYPTLGMLYQEKENRCETLFIPVVGTEDGVPVVQKYFVWKRGRAAGMTESAAALLSCFTQNGMEAYTLVLSEGAIRLTSPHNRISFADGEAGRRIVVDVYCDGETLYRRTAGGTPITEQQLEREAEAYMNEIARAALEESVDVTNSYRKLGGYKRDWYVAYQNPHKSYEEEMEIVYDLHVTWVNL